MKYLNYIFIVLGAIVAIYAKTGTEQNEYVLIGGIALLMVGIYRISKTIPSRNGDDTIENNEN
jgi:hypothetical membrane protein